MEKILLVEDEETLGMVLKEELAIHGHRITWVKNGVEAVLAVLDNLFDVLIVDMVMPQMSGINTLRIIKKIAPDIAVIACSGRVGKDIMTGWVMAGASACLNKPFTISQMLSHIKWVTRDKKDRR